MEAISYSEAMDALRAWRKFERSAANANTTDRFERFLDCPIFTGQRDMIDIRQFPAEVREDVARKIRWLNGPHGYTLFKAWKAQHENQ